MKHKGSCHCKKIQFEIEADITKGMSCNCSICKKKGTILTFIPEENFKLISGEENLKAYLFNKKIITHYFCTHCGVSPFAKGIGHDGKPVRAINIRCIDELDLSKMGITEYNGKDI